MHAGIFLIFMFGFVNLTLLMAVVLMRAYLIAIIIVVIAAAAAATVLRYLNAKLFPLLFKCFFLSFHLVNVLLFTI